MTYFEMKNYIYVLFELWEITDEWEIKGVVKTREEAETWVNKNWWGRKYEETKFIEINE